MNWSNLRISWKTTFAAIFFLWMFLQGFSTVVGPWVNYLYPPETPDGLNPKLLGMWHEKYQYPQRKGVVGFEGTTEFFRNKTYRITGLLNSTEFNPIPLSPITTSYKFDGNGEWQATNNELVTKLLGVKTRVTSVTIAGTTYKVHGMLAGRIAEESEIERALLLAQSQRYDIRSTDKNEVVLETNGLFADSYAIKMTRTKQMYMR